MTSMAHIAPFTRTRLTWQGYFSISYYSYLLNALGPLTPFLRADLDLSYTAAAFHFSAFALGIIANSLLIKRAAGWLGGARGGATRLVWLSASGMGVGALLLIAGRHPILTTAGTFLMGFLGITMIAIFQSALAEAHGENRAIALTETSVVASVFGLASPLAVGFFARSPLTWRAALALGLLGLPLLAAAFWRDPVPLAGSQSERGSPHLAAGRAAAIGPLPRLYWMYWLAVLLAVSIEFCLIFWGADYLEKTVGLERADAALGMSFFMGAMLAGRALLSGLLRRAPVRPLLLASLILSTAGFLLFWAASPGALGVGMAASGLALAGIGIAGLYPMMAALGMAACPERMVEASARFTLAAGLAILLLPMLLGRLADWAGIRAAYGLVAVLLALAILLTEWARRRDNR